MTAKVRTYWMPNIKARAALAACDLISHHSKDVQAMTAETSEIEDQLQAVKRKRLNQIIQLYICTSLHYFFWRHIGL